MIRKLTRKAHVVAVLIVFVALSALAQTTSAGQTPEQSFAVSVPAQASTPARLLLRSLLPGASNTQRISAARLQGKEAVAAAPDSEGVSFLPSVTYSSGCLPWSVVVGDVNGDGHPDLVVANWYQSCTGIFGPGAVRVLPGNGDGTFQSPVSYGSGGFQALSVAIGDFNGDGKLDLAVANDCAGDDRGNCANGGAGQVGVLMGNGDGTFQPAVSYFTGGAIGQSVVIADVNSDGHSDLVVGNYCHDLGGACNNASAGVLLGNGDGTFQPAIAYTAGYLTVSEAVADLNGDGKLDLVVVGGQDIGVVGVLLGNGDGTFQPEVSYNWGGYQPNSVAIADVNGDGYPDLVVASYCQDLRGVCNRGSLGVLLGNGDGTFQAPVNYSSGGFAAFSVAIGDVNGDGHPDLAVATIVPNGPSSLGPGEVGVLLGTGDGTFQPAVAFPSGGTNPISVVVADVNGNGKSDLLVINLCDGNEVCSDTRPGTVGVLLNNAGTPQAPTTTALISSPNPSAYGQSVTFTARVRSASGTPTGTAILYDGPTSVGSAKLASGRAAISVSSLAAGSHSIIAIYQGSSSFAPSTSASLNQVVSTAPTATSLVSSANPAAPEQTVTYTATVIGQYGGGVATGKVTFRDGVKTVATVSVNGNQAAYSRSYPSPGIHSITATYTGDSNNGGSTSPALTEAIGNLPYPSVTTVATSGSPSFVTQPVTFTATVTFKGGTIPNGQPVTFYDRSAEIGTSTTAGGVATFTASSLTAGRHTIKATYPGDGTFKASSGTVTQVVDKYATTTALVSSLNPSAYKQAVTFTATVTGAGPSPTGKVWFKDGTIGIGAVTLSSGVATLTKRWLAVGTHPITAQYLGNAFSDKSTSSVVNQVVQ